MAGDELRRRVQHDVGAETERTLAERCREGVVDDDEGAGGLARRAEHRQVRDLERRVGRGLDEQQVRPVEHAEHRVRVGHVHQTHRQAVALAGQRQLAERAEVAVVRGDDDAVGRDRRDDRRDGGQARGVREPAAALQGAQGGLECLPGGVSVAPVLEVTAGHVRGREHQGRVQRCIGHDRGPAGHDGQRLGCAISLVRVRPRLRFPGCAARGAGRRPAPVRRRPRRRTVGGGSASRPVLPSAACDRRTTSLSLSAAARTAAACSRPGLAGQAVERAGHRHRGDDAVARPAHGGGDRAHALLAFADALRPAAPPHGGERGRLEPRALQPAMQALGLLPREQNLRGGARRHRQRAADRHCVA